MTTVVFCKEQVASDTLMTESFGRISSNSYSKIFQNERYVIGMAGAAGQCQRVVDWILDGCVDEEGNPTMPYISDREEVGYTVAYIDKHTGKIFAVEGICFDVIEVDYPYAIGSGADFALGYLAGKRKGKNRAVQAVKAAADYDIATNHNITSIDVELDLVEEFEES